MIGLQQSSIVSQTDELADFVSLNLWSKNVSLQVLDQLRSLLTYFRLVEISRNVQFFNGFYSLLTNV